MVIQNVAVDTLLLMIGELKVGLILYVLYLMAYFLAWGYSTAILICWILLQQEQSPLLRVVCSPLEEVENKNLLFLVRG
jgi:hypothetical protein